MMNSLGLDCDKAFAPFFDTPIAVEGQRTGGRRIAGNFNACVFDNGFADPFADADADSVIHTFSISIMAGDWLENRPPQVGDKIVIALADACTPDLPSIKLAVSHVDSLLGDTWTLTAKEI